MIGIDDVYFGPMGEELDSEGLEFTNEICEVCHFSSALPERPPRTDLKASFLALY